MYIMLNFIESPLDHSLLVLIMIYLTYCSDCSLKLEFRENSELKKQPTKNFCLSMKRLILYLRRYLDEIY